MSVQLVNHVTRFITHDLARLDTPAAVMNELSLRAARPAGLLLVSMWRLPANYEDPDEYGIDVNTFIHPNGAPPAFWNEFFPLLHRRGPSVLVRYAIRRRISLTFAEVIHATNPTGNERWVFDLLAKYGIRDGLVCAASGGWVVTMGSPKQLKLSASEKAVLSMANTAAAHRMEELTRRRIKEKAPPSLSARQVAVLRGLSRGLTRTEIATDLDMTLPTVKTFLARALKKLRAKSPEHAIAIAIHLGLF